ncbi:MAG: hypothetical protein R3B51_10560 [Thermodesulfobacteriota bacterium]
MSNSESKDRQGLIRFLGSAKSYPHDPGEVTHLQTHASDVFVAPPYVYKVKKPVDFGFLDFTTLEKGSISVSAKSSSTGDYAPAHISA